MPFPPEFIIFFASLFIVLRSSYALKSVAFQGSCADDSVLCEQLCIAISSETYECGCWDDHYLLDDGSACIANKSKVHVELPPTKTKDADEREGREPNALGFSGSHFVRFSPPDSAYLETNVTIEFRFDEERDGILLYAGEMQGNDFFSLAIVGNDVILRFDCGEGTVEDLYSGPFDKRVWHSLSVERKYCSSSKVKVDKRDPMSDEISELSNYKGITIDESIFVGGAPTLVNRLSERAGTSDSFKGCIRRIILNGVTLFDAKTSVNTAIGHYETCKTVWENDAKLTISFPDDLSLLDADTANKTTSESASMPAKSASVPSNSSSSPADRKHSSTHHEEKVESTTVLPKVIKAVEFDGDSYVKLRSASDVDVYLELSVHLKPNDASGLLYLHRSTAGRYLAVFLDDAFICVQFSLGADHVILRSERPIALNYWERVEVWRSGRAALLKVGKQRWVENRVKNDEPNDANTEFSYFGGAPDEIIPTEVTIRDGFSGCLKKVHQNTRVVHLLSEALVAENTHECGWEPCVEWSCASGARCEDRHASAVCMCRYPFYGPHCQDDYDKPPSVVNFSRYSYLQFASHRIMKHVSGESLDISMVIRPNVFSNVTTSHTSHQILAYAGDNDNVGDFLRLLITNRSEVQLVLNLGSGSVSLVHPTVLTPSVWHNITASRDGQQVSLVVNGSSITTASPGSAIEMNVYDSLFIGGIPKGDSSLDGFDGCLRDLRIGFEPTESPLNATEAVNISPCIS